eukprot:gb/GECG01004701.1/.p2 GENE.gb/GECG01004701.1/~~gb/GECG01004701.1/.p2  ORF type:complete len:128 (-),score=4.35 gb/GECG01004701.1/:186-569(-)
MGSSNCSACPAGEYKNGPANCSICALGETSSSGSEYCIPCSQAEYSSVDHTICFECPCKLFETDSQHSSGGLLMSLYLTCFGIQMVKRVTAGRSNAARVLRVNIRVMGQNVPPAKPVGLPPLALSPV